MVNGESSVPRFNTMVRMGVICRDKACHVSTQEMNSDKDAQVYDATGDDKSR